VRSSHLVCRLCQTDWLERIVQYLDGTDRWVRFEADDHELVMLGSGVGDVVLDLLALSNRYIFGASIVDRPRWSEGIVVWGRGAQPPEPSASPPRDAYP
jgi:hypothetical protein